MPKAVWIQTRLVSLLHSINTPHYTVFLRKERVVVTKIELMHLKVLG